MTAAALSMILAAPLPATSFFPTAEGTTWTYEESVNGLKETVVDRALPITKLGDLDQVWPISTSSPSAPPEKTYYRLEEGAVWTIAYDGGRLLEKPVPVFLTGEGKKDWKFSGNVQFVRGTAKLDLKGSSKLGPETEVLGTKRRILRVEVSGTLTPDSGNQVTSSQVALYAENVGLYSFEQRAEVNEFKVFRTRKLIKFEEGPKRD